MGKDVIDAALENGFKIRVCEAAIDGGWYYKLEDEKGILYGVTIERLN